jgi:hypothetical protein
MRGFFGLAAAVVAALVMHSVAIPLVATAGKETSIVITDKNTLNGTLMGDAFVPAASSSFSPLTFSFKNTYKGGNLNAYITGLDSTGAIVLLRSDGTFFRPGATNSKTPVRITAANLAISLGGNGQTTNIVLPQSISSGRVWVSEGQLSFFTVLAGDGTTGLVQPSFADPNDPSATVNWGFIELTVGDDNTIWANLSFVDFVGFVMGMSVTYADGSTQTVPGLKAGSVTSICNDMKSQAASDGQPWDKMCVTDGNGKALRILAPNIYHSINPSSMASYYTSYVDQVWSKYTNEDLIFNLGNSGMVHCRVQGSTLVCPGDDVNFPKPSVGDIWGCASGSFAAVGNGLHELIRPILCAAFTRSTLLMSGGNVQPSLSQDNYYKNSPTNHYSRIVHQYEIGNRGYAFSFDDVNPVAGVDASGLLSGPNARTLTLNLGGQ